MRVLAASSLSRRTVSFASASRAPLVWRSPARAACVSAQLGLHRGHAELPVDLPRLVLGADLAQLELAGLQRALELLSLHLQLGGVQLAVVVLEPGDRAVLVVALQPIGQLLGHDVLGLLEADLALGDLDVVALDLEIALEARLADVAQPALLGELVAEVGASGAQPALLLQIGAALALEALLGVEPALLRPGHLGLEAAHLRRAIAGRRRADDERRHPRRDRLPLGDPHGHQHAAARGPDRVGSASRQQHEGAGDGLGQGDDDRGDEGRREDHHDHHRQAPRRPVRRVALEEGLGGVGREGARLVGHGAHMPSCWLTR